MNKQPSRGLFVPALILLILGTAVPARPQAASRRADDVWGPRFEASSAKPDRPQHPAPHDTLSRLRHWNEVAVNSSGLTSKTVSNARHRPPAP